jgi:thiol-disulfide isomerase/thioredoxin
VLSVIAALGLAARVVLFAVFALAGVTKLADRAGTARAAAAFGAPRRLAGPLAIAIPVAELAVAALVLPAATAVAGAAGAVALLAAFSSAIAITLAQGRSIDCHCFGSARSAPISAKTLARNAGLAAVAAIAFAASLAVSPLSAVAWIGRLEGAVLVAVAATTLAVAILVGASLAFLSLLRSYGNVLVRLERVERALASAGVSLSEPKPGRGGAVPSANGRPQLLVFTSSDCTPCRALGPQLDRWRVEYADRLTITPVDVADEGPTYEAFGTPGTPSAVLIRPDGNIAGPPVHGHDAIERLVEQNAGHPHLPIGAPAPSIELDALDGSVVKLDELQGRETVLVFWDPSCGFCRAMHQDLLGWERARNGVGSQLVLVSSGDEEMTRAEGFRSTVLLDKDFAVGRSFGARGTPTAVRLAADGTVASDVVVGSAAILALGDGETTAADPPLRAP